MNKHVCKIFNCNFFKEIDNNNDWGGCIRLDCLISGHYISKNVLNVKSTCLYYKKIKILLELIK